MNGLGDPSQLPVGDADADADVALAWGWGASAGAGRDLVAVHHDRRLRRSRAVFSALGPWPMSNFTFAPPDPGPPPLSDNSLNIFDLFNYSFIHCVLLFRTICSACGILSRPRPIIYNLI